MATIGEKFTQLGTSIINLVGTRASRHLDNLTTTGRENIKNIVEEVANFGKSQITNCLLEVPQRIIVEINNGTLNVKAGSVVVVPNGFEADGITPKFEHVTIEQEQSLSIGFSGTYDDVIICYNPKSKTFGEFRRMLTESSSGAGSFSKGYYYDTSTNLISYYPVSGTTDGHHYSFPIGLFFNQASEITGINCLFNGLGFIGSTLWIDKDVKGLAPNGRKSDGTLNNVGWKTNKVQIITDTSVAGSNYMRFGYNAGTQKFQLMLGANWTFDEESNIWNHVIEGKQIITDLGFYHQTATANSIIGSNFTIHESFRAIDSKEFYGSLNHSRISNCILELPQNIRYEINAAGRLILKADSKVYVSTNGTFEPVTLTVDTAEGAGGLWTTAHSRMLLVVYLPNTNTVTTVAWDYVYHQTSAPTTFLAGSAMWHDTSNNTLKYTADSGANWQICSLPILCGKPGGENIGWRGYVKQVFNGFGIFGTRTFTLPGVKSLIADGRNPDGTPHNAEVVSGTVIFDDASGLSSHRAFFTGTRVASYGVNNYFEQGTPPTDFGIHAIWYNTKENRVYKTGNSGSSWTAEAAIYLGALEKAPDGSYSDCDFRDTVQLADMQDCVRKSDFLRNPILTTAAISKSNPGYVKFSNGIIIQWGIHGNANANPYMITYPTAFTSSTSYSVQAIDTTIGSGNSHCGISTQTTTGCKIYHSTDGSVIWWMAIGY